MRLSRVSTILMPSLHHLLGCTPATQLRIWMELGLPFPSLLQCPATESQSVLLLSTALVTVGIVSYNNTVTQLNEANFVNKPLMALQQQSYALV